MFRINSGMFPCKMNMMSDPAYSKELWFCDECESQIDSLSHIAVCAAYQPLRAGRDINSDNDLVEYMTAVMEIRSKANRKKC